jgi:tetratricopeptide (TPR) repeat protein
VKTANVSIFIGVIVFGLISGRAPLHAQSSSTPVVTEGDDKSWSRGVPVEIREAARALFLEGNRLFKIPLFARAAEKYTAALSQWKHPAFYFNLALAQLNLGQEVEARENLEQALKYGEEPLGAEQFQEARKQLQEVEQKLGRIHITCQTKGAEVTLDGTMLFIGPGSYAGWIKAKNHEITAKKQDYLSEARRVTISPGKLEELELRLVTLSEAADIGRRWSTWKPWGVVATGGGIAVVGGTLHVFAARKFNDYDKRFQELPCAQGDSPRCLIGDAKVKNLNDRLKLPRREQEIAVGSYIVGGSLVATGIMLLYLNRPHLIEQRSATSSVRRIEVAPTVSGDMLGILVMVSH